MFDFGNANINQKEAITHTEGPLLIIAGPGTGKTTTVIKLLLLLLSAKKENLKITLCAPTGKASSRMVESITNGLSSKYIDDAIKGLCELNKEIVKCKRYMQDFESSGWSWHHIRRVDMNLHDKYKKLEEEKYSYKD